MKNLKLITRLLAIALFVTSCSKDEAVSNPVAQQTLADKQLTEIKNNPQAVAVDANLSAKFFKSTKSETNRLTNPGFSGSAYCKGFYVFNNHQPIIGYWATSNWWGPAPNQFYLWASGDYYYAQVWGSTDYASLELQSNWGGDLSQVAVFILTNENYWARVK